jgi:L-ribulose-5-phosphate 3-epimerase UlaE
MADSALAAMAENIQMASAGGIEMAICQLKLAALGVYLERENEGEERRLKISMPKKMKCQ